MQNNLKMKKKSKKMKKMKANKKLNIKKDHLILVTSSKLIKYSIQYYKKVQLIIEKNFLLIFMSN